MPGRGGAGNIQNAQQETARIAEDLEANQNAAETYSAPTPTRVADYAKSGRGGAGNYYSPKELAEQGAQKDSNTSQAIGDGVNTLGNEPTASSSQSKAAPLSKTYGRGGVGNYAFDASENQERALKKRMDEEERKREKLKADIEQGVRDTLAMPPKAKLPGGEPY